MFDKEIKQHLNSEAHIIVEGGKGEPNDFSEHPFDCGPDFQEEFDHIVSNKEFTEAGYDFCPYVYYNTCLNMESTLPKRGEPEPHLAYVTYCLRNANALPIGNASDNYILDTRMYDVEYVEREKSALSANIIADFFPRR